MSLPVSLSEAFRRTVKARPDHPAFREVAGSSLTYGELGDLAADIRDRLHVMEVSAGDRVGIYLPKSLAAIAAIFGILEAGAAYVVLEPSARASRAGEIFSDCRAKVVMVDATLEAELAEECRRAGHLPIFLRVDLRLEARESLSEAFRGIALSQSRPVQHAPEDPAYILYTSGSSGKPKGVVLSHGAGASFIQWCVETLPIGAEDRFSMHSPLHFDLSVLDIHATVRVGATGILIPEALGRNPAELVRAVALAGITVWYSVPTALNLMATIGGLDRSICPSLRLVLFAGEPYPIAQFRRLAAALPEATFFNLYGPTETNVCTYYRVPTPLSEDFNGPLPIGNVCSQFRTRLSKMGPTEESELWVSGAGVMSGYWNQPDLTHDLIVQDENGTRWYRTGDLVREGPGNCLTYLGRLDRMIKKRGYRIEPGEIEHLLESHPAIDQAAVMARRHDQDDVYLTACLSVRGPLRPSIIELRAYCNHHLPSVMVPDHFVFLDRLPTTPNGKTDFLALGEKVREGTS